jgi:hypothetical protein
MGTAFKLRNHRKNFTQFNRIENRERNEPVGRIRRGPTEYFIMFFF